MSHNLATIDGRVAMTYQGETPWHKLGFVLPDGMVSIDTAMTAASIDKVVVHLERMLLADGTEVPKRFAVVSPHNATTNILGTVSDWYQPIQYTDAFSLFQPAVEEFGLTVEAAGVLGNGKSAWMLFKMPLTMSPVPGDVVEGYGLAHTGHDGKTVFQFRPTGVRVVCQNTVDMALGADQFGRTNPKGRIFSIPHIGNVTTEIEKAREVVLNAIEAMTRSGDTFTAMAAREMDSDELIAYIENVLPAKDKNGKPTTTVTEQLAQRRRDVSEQIFTGVGAELAMSSTNGKPNMWAAYNGVTGYFDHFLKGEATEKRIKAHAQAAAFGQAAEIKLSALRFAEQVVYA